MARAVVAGVAGDGAAGRWPATRPRATCSAWRGSPASRRPSGPSELIPLCHPLALSFVGVEGSIDVERGEIELIAEARTTGPTGVEMEALTAASVAALTVYDMVKGIERGAEIAAVVLLEKSGGRSGEWRRRRVVGDRPSRKLAR